MAQNNLQNRQTEEHKRVKRRNEERLVVTTPSHPNLVEEHLRQHLLHRVIRCLGGVDLLHPVKLHGLLQETVPVVIDASVAGANKLSIRPYRSRQLPCGMIAPNSLESDPILRCDSSLPKHHYLRSSGQ